MRDAYSRLELLLGEETIESLSGKRVAIFGVGGVGGYVVEALARSGIGHFLLVDDDEVAESNINRQIIATVDVIGQPKVEVAKKRILSINPDADVEIRKCFYLPEEAKKYDFASFDYVVDAIDTVTAKIDLVLRCQGAGTKIICALGCGNKIDPTRLAVCDLYKTEMDPLAKVMRRELRRRGVKSLKVVYSKEKPIAHKKEAAADPGSKRRAVPGSTAFVPPAAGLLIASVVVRDLIGYEEE